MAERGVKLGSCKLGVMREGAKFQYVFFKSFGMRPGNLVEQENFVRVFVEFDGRNSRLEPADISRLHVYTHTRSALRKVVMALSLHFRRHALGIDFIRLFEFT